MTKFGAILLLVAVLGTIGSRVIDDASTQEAIRLLVTALVRR